MDISLAPDTLLQSILRGWIFAQTVYVNESNSSMPEAEKAIVAQDSYGRQLGKILDALAYLAQEKKKEKELIPPANRSADVEAGLKALDDLLSLSEKIKDTKKKFSNERCVRVRGDLAYLKIVEPEDYKALLDEIIGGQQAGVKSSSA